MWIFNDNEGKECCLIPEVTGVLQKYFNEKLYFEYKKKPLKLFYVNRCYRYETPQKGRYREFTQFGIEILGGSDRNETELEAINILKNVLNLFPNIEFEFKNSVKRGIGYYTKNGFEVECKSLGSQKQIAGGGSYNEGVGWAIGIDRLILSM